MKIKLVDYDIEHKGSWDFGSKYWLTEQFTDNKGRPKSNVLIATNNLDKVLNRLKELDSKCVKMEFVKNESFNQHVNNLKLVPSFITK